MVDKQYYRKGKYNDYFRDAVGYLKEFEDNDAEVFTMFDWLGMRASAESEGG